MHFNGGSSCILLLWEVRQMILCEITLDEIFEMLKADCLDTEERKAKAETEYILQKSKNETRNDEER